MKIKTRTYLKDLAEAYQAGYEAGFTDADAQACDNDRYRRLNDEVFHMRDEVFSMRDEVFSMRDKMFELERKAVVVHKEKKHKKKYAKPRILGVVKVGSVCHDHEAKPANVEEHVFKEAPTGSEAPAQAAQE